jgi:uncharacterized protein YgiM (DUF1202 family)
MTKWNAPRSRRSIRTMFGKIVAGGLGLAMILAAGTWLSTQFFGTRAVAPPEQTVQSQGTSFFDYTVAAEVGHIRVSGTANFPNGIILVGTLDRIGSGPIEVKEALVMNRLFALEFGPELNVQYYLHDPHDALQAGIYRISVEFDPAQQSPFAQESLLRWSQSKASPPYANNVREIDPAIIRVSKTFDIGTLDEQQEAQAHEQVYRETIRQHLSETLGTLTKLWQRLRAHYQQERLRGGFARTDPRGDEWRTWNTQWLNDLKAVGEKGRLTEVASPASPLLAARDALLTGQKHLAVLSELYVEVLTNERSVADRDLKRTEQAVQYMLADVSAQLGHPEITPPPVKGEAVKPTVIITAPLVNIRNRPGMSHEAISQAKKDDVFDFLAEQGEWFQVELSRARTGWVHRNVASKRPQADGTAEETKRPDVKLMAVERKAYLQLEPIKLLATPIEYIPRPTSDEFKIYAELELQLRNLQIRGAEERKVVEQHIVQRTSEKFGLSPEQIWSAYLKVQGWEIKQ